MLNYSCKIDSAQLYGKKSSSVAQEMANARPAERRTSKNGMAIVFPPMMRTAYGKRYVIGTGRASARPDSCDRVVHQVSSSTTLRSLSTAIGYPSLTTLVGSRVISAAEMRYSRATITGYWVSEL